MLAPHACMACMASMATVASVAKATSIASLLSEKHCVQTLKSPLFDLKPDGLGGRGGRPHVA